MHRAKACTPVAAVSAIINLQPAQVLFVGQAPGLIAGLVQVNVQIPAKTASGAADVSVNVGEYRTQIGPTTISVK